MLWFQWCMSQTINGFDDVKFEAASVLADLFEAQGQPAHSKPILRKAIELSQHSVYWHCRLIFQLAVSIQSLLFCVIYITFCSLYAVLWMFLRLSAPIICCKINNPNVCQSRIVLIEFAIVMQNKLQCLMFMIATGWYSKQIR